MGGANFWNQEKVVLFQTWVSEILKKGKILHVLFPFIFLFGQSREQSIDWYWDWDWDKFIQHKMTLYRCMISDIHDSSYALFSTNLISHTSLHVGRPLLRPFLVAYAEATLARQKKIAQQTKSVDIISEYLLWTNGQLFEMNVKIVSSYWQAGKAFDPLQHD